MHMLEKTHLVHHKLRLWLGCRYLAVVHPFRLLALRTRSKTIGINLLVWLISLIMVVPVWVHSKVIRFSDGLESCTMNLVSPSAVLW